MGVKSSKIILNYALRTKGNEQTVICSMSVRGGGGVLINKHELVIITGISIDCPRKYVAEFINILSRLLMMNDLRKCVKERLSQERSKEFYPRMRMLIPAQYPKMWWEQRIGN